MRVELTVRRVAGEVPRIAVEGVFPAVPGGWLAQLPVWRPGRYERQDFAKFLYRLEIWRPESGWVFQAKSDLHSWPIPPDVTRLRWSFFAGILDAGSTWVGEDLFYINPVNCMLYAPAHPEWSFALAFPDLAADWTVASALPREGDRWIARDADHLFDSPWVASPALRHAAFACAGVDFHVWMYRGDGVDWGRLVEDHRRFTETQVGYFGGEFPEPVYHYIYLLPDRSVRHGVEHADSTVIVLGPDALSGTDEGYAHLIDVGSHELYHAWNVKRIRPAEWMPYDFTRPHPSRMGYVAEGVTTYMGDLMLLESGVIDLQGWCDRMELLLHRHVNNPGRLQLSVADSGFDTWLDGYVPGVPGRKGSIYVEGAVLAFLCDVRILQVSGGKASLQTAMRALWKSHGEPRKGLTEADYWQALDDAAGPGGATRDLRERFCHGTEDTWPALVEAFESQGLKLHRQENPDRAGFDIQLAPLPSKR